MHELVATRKLPRSWIDPKTRGRLRELQGLQRVCWMATVKGDSAPVTTSTSDMSHIKYAYGSPRIGHYTDQLAAWKNVARPRSGLRSPSRAYDAEVQRSLNLCKQLAISCGDRLILRLANALSFQRHAVRRASSITSPYRIQPQSQLSTGKRHGARLVFVVVTTTQGLRAWTLSNNIWGMAR